MPAIRPTKSSAKFSSRRVLLAAAAGLAVSTAGLTNAGASAVPARALSHANLPAGSSFSGTLNIMGFGTNGDDVAQTRLKLAEAAVAPAQVSAPNGGFTDQSFLADLASGNVPDLVYMNSYQLGTYAAKGAIQPLTSCLTTQHINMGVFTKAARDMATYHGQVYGLPEFTDDRTLIVNNKAVASAGLKPSDISTVNWAKLSQIAKKLTVIKKGKLQTIGFDPKLPEFFPIWVKANGGAIVSNNGLKAELNSRQDVQALEYAVSLIREQGGYSRFVTYRNTFNYFGSNSPFAEDQLAVTPFENWMYNVIASTTPNVRVTAVPFKDKHGRVIDYETGSVWVIPKGAKNVAAACQFAATMTSTQTWLAAAHERINLYKSKHYAFTGLLTGNHVADRDILGLAESTSKGSPWLQPVRETYAVEAGSFTVPSSPASEAVQNAWTTAVTSVLEGQMGAQKALNQAQATAQAAINAAKS
jgi:multiple sugar transport system substrate-binding protein